MRGNILEFRKTLDPTQRGEKDYAVALLTVYSST